jgi:hypothetical protein
VFGQERVNVDSAELYCIPLNGGFEPSIINNVRAEVTASTRSASDERIRRYCLCGLSLGVLSYGVLLSRLARGRDCSAPSIVTREQHVGQGTRSTIFNSDYCGDSPLATGVWRLGYQSFWVGESVCVAGCDPMSLLRRLKTAEAGNALVRWAEAVS